MWSAWPASGAGDGERIEQAHVRTGAALGLLAGAGERERVGVVAEREQERDGEGGARGQAGADGERAGDPDAAARGWRLEPEEAGRQEGLGGDRGGGAQRRSRRAGRGTGPSRYPTRKLPGFGVKVTSVASSMAMGSERPPL